MNNSGEFQDIESNYSGRLSHVSSQPEMVPSSRALPSRDKRLPFDTWNQSGVPQTFVKTKKWSVEMCVLFFLKMMFFLKKIENPKERLEQQRAQTMNILDLFKKGDTVFQFF